jgi:hypothetical protein
MLRLLLDEHISPDVAKSLRRRDRTSTVHAMTDWEDGNFLGQEDAVCLKEATMQRLTFVTYDRRTIPPLLKAWAEQGRPHAGVIFVDDKTIAPSNIGGLVLALAGLQKEARNWDWTGRVCFLTKSASV